MESVAHLLTAIASLLWPLVFITVVLIFRRDLSDLVRRLRRGKLFGQELELDETLVRFRAATIEAAAELPQKPVAALTGNESANLALVQPDYLTILTHAIESPHVALIMLATDIEKECREIVASTGLLKGRSYRSITHALDLLVKNGSLPSHVAQSLTQFWSIRNRYIHTRPTDSSGILSAIDSGLVLLKTLRSLPRVVAMVHRVNVKLYADSATQHDRLDVKGVILEMKSERPSAYHIHPTTRQYTVGNRVAWEWNSMKDWGETWYRDPDTSEVKYAWTESMEFVGRPIEEV